MLGYLHLLVRVCSVWVLRIRGRLLLGVGVLVRVLCCFYGFLGSLVYWFGLLLMIFVLLFVVEYLRVVCLFLCGGLIDCGYLHLLFV